MEVTILGVSEENHALLPLVSPQGPNSQGEFAALGVKTAGSQLPSRHQPSGRPHSGPSQIPVGNTGVLPPRPNSTNITKLTLFVLKTTINIHRLDQDYNNARNTGLRLDQTAQSI